jgi:hypothetical protein
MSGYLPGCGMLSGWSVWSKVMGDLDHRRKVGVDLVTCELLAKLGVVSYYPTEDHEVARHL